MEIVNRAVDFIIKTIIKNKRIQNSNLPDDQFVSDSMKWIQYSLERGENVGIVSRIENAPESLDVRDELRSAVESRTQVTGRYLSELECWVEEYQKSKPMIRLTKSGMIDLNAFKSSKQKETNKKIKKDKKPKYKTGHISKPKIGSSVDFEVNEKSEGAIKEGTFEKIILEKNCSSDFEVEAGESKPSLNKRGWRRFFGTKRKKLEKDPEEKVIFPKKITQHDLINFSVFAPEKIKKNNPFILDIWAYLDSDSPKVKQKAKELDRGQIVGTKEGVSISKGSILQVTLSSSTLEIEDPIDHFTWSGVPTNVSYIIKTREETQRGMHIGKAIVSCEGIPVAKISFQLKIIVGSKDQSVIVTASNDIPNKAFASYASENREEVLSRVQGIKTALPYLDIFIDSLSLKAGDDWLEKLEENIIDRDIFYLFWSVPASQSDWVKTEWQLALKAKGIDHISPIPLEDPSICPPPRELKSLHFNDPYLQNIKYLQYKKQAEKNS